MRNKKVKEIRRAIKLGWQGTTETMYICQEITVQDDEGIDRLIRLPQTFLDPLCFRKLYKTVKKNIKGEL